MKTIIATAFLMLSLIPRAQEYTLENKWVKGSNQIYYGVNNYLIIKGEVDSIKKIESNAGIQRQHDSLLVMPSQEKVLITLHTNKGKSSFEYKASNLPMPKINFRCRDFNKTAKSIIIEMDTANYLYPFYTILQYTINIDGRKLMGNSNYMTSAILDAINKSPDGGKIYFSEVLYWNKETDNYLWIKMEQSWIIDRSMINGIITPSTCLVEYLKSPQ